MSLFSIFLRHQFLRFYLFTEDASSRSSTPTVDIYSKKYKTNPKRKATDDIDSDDEQAKRPKQLQKKSNKYNEFTDSEYISDGYINASSDALRAKSVSPVHKKKKVFQKNEAKKMSKSKENSDVEYEDKVPEEDEVFEDDDIDSMSVCSSSLKLDQDGTMTGSASRTSSVAEPDKYQFDLKPHHVVKSRLGRKVFKCDICMAVYRHAFSLKRHYIRNHINYTYVTKGDLQNCQITNEALETLAMAMALQKKQKEQVELVKQAASSEETDKTEISPSKDGATLQTEYSEASDKGVKLSNESQESQNLELLLSPGKDENRNKIIDDDDKAGSNKENEMNDSTIPINLERNCQESVETDNKHTSEVRNDFANKCEGKNKNDKISKESDIGKDKSSEVDGSEPIDKTENNSADKQKLTATNNANANRDRCENEQNVENEGTERTNIPHKEREHNKVVSEQTDHQVDREQCEENCVLDCKNTELEVAADASNEGTF